MRNICLLFLGVLFCLFTGSSSRCVAQTGDGYLSSSPIKSHLDKGKWEQIKKDYDYAEKKPEKKQEKKKTPAHYSSNSFAWLNSPVWKYVFISIVILVLAFLLIRIIGGISIISNTAVKPTQFSLEQMEENLPEYNLQSPLDKALADKNYRLAVRLYYLLVIQQLSEKNIIRWQREKTNNQYLVEAYTNAVYPLFRSLTLSFDWIWYGEREINEPEFIQLRSKFDELLTGIKQAV